MGVDLDDKDIAIAVLQVVSGDEILYVARDDGTTECYDADVSGRFVDYLDYTFVLVLNGEWQVDRERFLARKHSYDTDWAD